MQVNHVPSASLDNPTGCCPRFYPEEWEGVTFTFKEKPFVRFSNHNLFYIPLDMNRKFVSTMRAVEEAGAADKQEHLMLSVDISPWKSEHLLAVTKSVAGLDNVKMSGKYLAKVFEGPYQEIPHWLEAMKKYVRDHKKKAKKIYFNYTMCPKCSKKYGVNFVVALAELV